MKRASLTPAAITLVALACAATTNAHAQERTAPLVAIDRATSLASQLGPRDELVLQGSVRSSIDGTRFDASELFDLDGGGFAVVDAHPDVHAYRVRVVASAGTGVEQCARAGVTAPCLLPRLATFAHARLVTTDELARSLSGAIVVDVVHAPLPPPPPMEPATRQAIALIATSFVVTLTALLAALAWRRHNRSAIGRVKSAARDARRATTGDPTLAVVHATIADLVARADALEHARRVSESRLRKLDRRALERQRAAWAASNAPESGEALRWLTAECAEAARLESDFASSLVGLERIAAALRVVALRARRHDGVRARARLAHDDPVDVLASELALRDEAIAQARALVHDA